MSLTALFTDMKLAEHRLNNLERKIEDGITTTNSYRSTGHSNIKLLCRDGNGEGSAKGKRLLKKEES